MNNRQSPTKIDVIERLVLITIIIILNLTLSCNSIEYNPYINYYDNNPFESQRYVKDSNNNDMNNDTENTQNLNNTSPNNATHCPSFITTDQTLKSLHQFGNKFCSSCLAKSFNNSTTTTTTTTDTTDDDSIIKIGFLTNIHGQNNPQRQGIVISGALTYAISKVNNDMNKFNGKRIELIASDTEGLTLNGTSAILDQWRRGAMAFFGPEDSCEVEATIASAINLPMISYKCADSKASNKHFYRTFVRTHPPDTQIVSSVIALLNHFNWNKFSIISEKSTQYQTVARNLAERARAQGITINSESKFENIYNCCVEHKSCCHDTLYNIIEDTFKKTRIYVFLGTINDLISMMQVMQVKNLLNTGNYLVIYIDLDQYSKSYSYKYFWRIDMDNATKATMSEAARSLLVVVTSPPNVGTYSDFEENVRAYNALPPFCFTQPFDKKKYKKHITVYASYLYDAFMLYADALEETIKEGEDIYDGAAIIKRIINRKSYQSITGPWMNIDSNGDVEGNYSVLALKPASPDLNLKVNVEVTMLPVFNFYYENNSLKLSGGTIEWPKGRGPPLDEPVCSYDGSECRRPPDSFRGILAMTQLCVLATLTIIVFQVYRNWKKEQEIAGLLWKMDFDDIQFHDGQLHRTQSRSSFASQLSNDSLGFYRNKNANTKTAIFKGSIVAIKELKFSSKKDKDIPRSSKVEMKLMKEIRHDNINQFIGACIKDETNLIYIVSEYCSKGSLQDILVNPDVKLDLMFVSSLVFDLLSGLHYLHNSELRCHGNLKSSNCLITSRWVLKITDFGLHNFRLKAASVPVHENMRHTHYRNQLWKAPELLRNPTMFGNQKTDVYAFGIILHEIIARHGPFGIDRTSMKPEEVIDSIKHPKVYPNNQIFTPQQYSNALSNQTTSTTINSLHKQYNKSFQQSIDNKSDSSDQLEPEIPLYNRNSSQYQYNNTSKEQQLKQNVRIDMLNSSTVDNLRPETIYEEDEPETPFLNNNNSININNINDEDSKATCHLTTTRNGGTTTYHNNLPHQQPNTFVLFRPETLSLNCPKYIIDTMRDCWSERPECRPEMRTVRRKLEEMRQGRKYNIMDNMMVMMERYANNLEEIVQERTARLVEEKKKTEVLLHRMLPPSVAGQLMVGEEVEPESFDAVTIFFSDIVGFTEMSSKSSPMQVVVFLNDLYTLFDSIIQEYKVYKVETIGDAYMVVSGLPERIDDHANEIASMAIELLKSVEDFKIRHLPSETLQLRIGLHTGPVVSGVVGTKMPRYCLFGDTVNTASRMESHGKPLKIHASLQTKEYLDKFGNYILESRGLNPVKGKGNIETFWLLGHKNGTALYRFYPGNKISDNIGLFDAIGQKKSPRIGHNQGPTLISTGELFKLNCYTKG